MRKLRGKDYWSEFFKQNSRILPLNLALAKTMGSYQQITNMAELKTYKH